MSIEEIPDYPALQQLGRALWKIGKARGAAILVGAGFTKNAERVYSNTPEPPLWTDIARVMQERIYPGVVGQKDPLRLAEEFKVLLGEPALEDLIRDMVRDEEWLPGDLHKSLVKLPWTDILTTNWDTLIERAALENLGQTYETVRCVSDILTQLDCERLVAALGFIFIETGYSQQNSNEIEMISITLVRAAAVRLAGCLKRHGMCDDRLMQLLTDAELDPMPEVRFATATCEE